MDVEGKLMRQSGPSRVAVQEEDRSKEKDRPKEEGWPKEEEVDAYAVIPPNGGWGWVVVVCAFYCNVVVDGIQLTFGVFLSAISETFKAEVSQVALAGSLMFGIHLLMGPVCAGFSRVFGLRPVTITGSLICCIGIAASYFATGYWFLYISFGVIGGIGLGLVYMNSLVITSVYFTTLLPIAIAIVVCGTGVGTMVFAAAGNHLLHLTTWRNSFLMQAALAGSMALAAASFRPLKPVKIQISPSASHRKPDNPPQPADGEPGDTPSKTKMVLIKVPANNASLTSVHTVQSIIWNFAEEGVLSKKSDSPCDCRCPCWRKKREKPSEEAVVVLSEVRSDQRRKSYVEKAHLQEAQLKEEAPEKSKSRLFVRRMFERVDIRRQEGNRGCDAIKRTIRAMLDCHLMASYPFVMFTLSGAVQMAGFLIVFVYEKERCHSMGFSEEMSVNFVVCLGGANMFWRLFLGGLATLPKVKHWLLAIISPVIGGMAAAFSGFNSSAYYQFGFCFLFGLGIAGFAVFRIVLLVDLVGKEKIENATGINMLFMGIFCIVSPPFFGWLKELTDSYDIVFISTGILIVSSGMMLIGLHNVRI